MPQIDSRSANWKGDLMAERGVAVSYVCASNRQLTSVRGCYAVLNSL